MITIYRRAEVIARCERAEVLAGLRSGRFELTDHYESPETDGWISLTHFESRAYERPTSNENPTEHRFFCSDGDTIEPDASHRPIQDLKQLGELIRLSERRPCTYPAQRRALGNPTNILRGQVFLLVSDPCLLPRPRAVLNAFWGPGRFYRLDRRLQCLPATTVPSATSHRTSSRDANRACGPVAWHKNPPSYLARSDPSVKLRLAPQTVPGQYDRGFTELPGEPEGREAPEGGTEGGGAWAT